MRCGGTVALVTGGQQGIGRAIALALAREGADVVLNYLDDPDAAASIAKEISAAGRRCLPVQGDVSRASDVVALIDAAERGVGPIDTLINNAGTFPRSAFLDLTEAEWDRVQGVNLKGSFLAAQAVARRLVARGSPGAIINLASSAAYRSSPRGTHYVASKAGVVGLTRAMALELAPHAIRVNAIAPGLDRYRAAPRRPQRDRASGDGAPGAAGAHGAARRHRGSSRLSGLSRRATYHRPSYPRQRRSVSG